MKTFTNLKPEKVFYFFSEISKIPHGSGNTEQISRYLLDFAKSRSLKAVKDNGGNIIIYADGTEGYENSDPVIIQGHMDMVCEKSESCTKDMSVEGLDLCTDGEYIWAEDTTLGGDDGIAIAYILALLDSDDIPHPPIEAVITRDEETGMNGAEEFDSSLVKGKKLLNIDSEEEGILTVSCAGGITGHCKITLDTPCVNLENIYEISVAGLLGGHSGIDIGKGRQNAFKLINDVLSKISDFHIADVKGGGKMNVIPNKASVIIGTETDVITELEKLVSEYNAVNFTSDPDIIFSIKKSDTTPLLYNRKNTDTILKFLANAPTGVIKWSENIEGMVESSLNLGVFSVTEEKISADFLIRSNSNDGKTSVVNQLENFINTMNGTLELISDYPAWTYRKDSPLRDLMADTYRDMFGKEPVIAGIHAGLECGFFTEKIPDSDIVSFGPDIENIHTPAERLNIASVIRTWEYLIEVLKRCK
ncbi:MAG: aminoacyl-histidine dipeptidase [Ruminococcus sp.]|nr:aminoacyl-histidine dipeptidase [Ruminococcus sp.]